MFSFRKFKQSLSSYTIMCNNFHIIRFFTHIRCQMDNSINLIHFNRCHNSIYRF